MRRNCLTRSSADARFRSVTPGTLSGIGFVTKALITRGGRGLNGGQRGTVRVLSGS
jgi:hypothetical protein